MFSSVNICCDMIRCPILLMAFSLVSDFDESESEFTNKFYKAVPRPPKRNLTVSKIHRHSIFLYFLHAFQAHSLLFANLLIQFSVAYKLPGSMENQRQIYLKDFYAVSNIF